MQKQTKNTVWFIVLMVLCFFIWLGIKTWLFPPPPPPPPPVPDEAYQAAALLGASDGGLGQGLAQAAVLTQESAKAAPEAKAPEKEKPAPPPVALEQQPPTPNDQLQTLGEIDRRSKYHLYVQLDKHGAGVRGLTANKFQKADQWGRPVNEKDGSPTPEDLIPTDPDNLSFLLLAYDVFEKDADKPLDTLARVDWTVDGPTKDVTKDGRERESVTYTSPPLKEMHGCRVVKTFSLTQGDYHLGLEVKVERVGGDDKPVWFRYQMSGGHGLPIEGRWYTYTFHNSLIGQVEEGKPNYARGVSRDFQDLHQIASQEGGSAPPLQPGYLFRYAGVAVQYFASLVVVDNDQKDQRFLASAQPTLETEVVKGAVASVGPDGKSFVLVRDSDKKLQTFYIRERDFAAEEQLLKDEGEKKFKADGRIPFEALHPDMRLAVVSTSGSYLKPSDELPPSFARQLRDENLTQPLWEDEVTVRVSTQATALKPGESFTHKYLLYNGPVKVMLLDQAETDAQRVPPGLVNRYIGDLNLDTMTDYPSASWIGSITGPTGISWMLIQVTNLMHWVLWFLHATLFMPYILCIICLTVMVRGVMFPVSRKQAITSLRMQQLGPEMKKLQEKYKDDKQALAGAQMELYRKHGVNPFGTCWLLLLQMPIFMGLYYSLQESIHFRLAGLAPWWMPNLAAPDMLLWWSASIPFISEPSWYGWLWYLGPYLNILPIAAVSLTLVQQKWTMPPPTDDTQAQQQKMMKYMMIFMGVMFYKLASGVCIYYTASSLWGIAERRFLPKKKPGAAGTPAADEEKPQGGLLSKLLGPKPSNGSSNKSKRGKRRPEGKASEKSDGMFQRLRDWWEEILEQARKK
jgi:YidC/Oxa1 family membrane protein insertase